MSKKKKIAPQASAPQPAQASGAPETEAKPIAPPGTDLFTQYGKYSSFITVGILLLIGIIVFRDFLTGEKIYYFKDITSDSYNFSYPILYNIADYIHTYGTPSWSFKVGMGQNIFPFFLRDPFDAILFLLGKDSISHGLVWLELLKITLAGYVFYRYLQLINLEKSITIIGAILFAYCGFMIEGSGWYLFTFEALNFALMLLAAEQLIAKGKSLLFPLTTFLIGISMPFNLYVDSLFIILYTIMRTYQIEGKLSFNIIRLYGQMLLLGFVGLLAAGPFLLENIVQLLESPRVGGTNSLTHQLMARPITEFSDKVELATSALRFFSNDMMGSGNDFKGWHNILEAPMFYCGIPCLLLAPQYIASLPANKRLFFIIFFVGWLLPAFFPYLRHAFWLFTGDYYRAYSFFTGLVFLYYSLHALHLLFTTKAINIPVLGGTVALLLLLLNYKYFDEVEYIDKTLQIFANLLIIAYAALLFLIAKMDNSANLRYIFFGIVAIEVVFLSGITIDRRDALTGQELTDKVGYNDYSVDAIKHLQQTDNSFYRVDKAYYSSMAIFGSLNDGQAQLYNGTSSYNPFNQLYYINYLQLMNLAKKNEENDSRWAKGLTYRPLLQMQNSVKYILAKKMFHPFWATVADTVYKTGDVTVLKNRYTLPWGFTYNAMMTRSEFETLSEMQKDFFALKACIVNDEDLSKHKFNLTPRHPIDTQQLFSIDSLISICNTLKQDTLTNLSIKETHLEGDITIHGNKMMYLSIPYDDGWHLTVDGKPEKKHILSAGMTGVYLSEGKHHIAMNYELRYFTKGLLMSLIGLIAYGIILYFYRRK